MPTIEIVPVPQLPDALTQEAKRAVRLHSVTMVVADEDETKGASCGGVFTIYAGIAGILTARHVWERIQAAKTLVLMVGTHQVYRIPTHLLTAHVPPSSYAESPFNAKIPDIAFIALSATDKTAIEARQKAFYSVDRRLKSRDIDLCGDDGFSVAIGSPKALMRPEEHAVSSLIYITDIAKKIERDKWDYLFVNLNAEENPALPVADFVGMSGGGIWRVRFEIDGQSYRIRNIGRDIILSGITFLQTAEPGRQLVAHGPKSIYQGVRTLVEGK